MLSVFLMNKDVYILTISFYDMHSKAAACSEYVLCHPEIVAGCIIVYFVVNQS